MSSEPGAIASSVLLPSWESSVTINVSESPKRSNTSSIRRCLLVAFCDSNVCTTPIYTAGKLHRRCTLVYSCWHTGINKIMFIYAIVCIYWTSSSSVWGILHYFYYRVFLGRPNLKYKKCMINIFRSVQVLDFVHYKPGRVVEEARKVIFFEDRVVLKTASSFYL